MKKQLGIAAAAVFLVALLLTLGHTWQWFSMPDWIPGAARWTFLALLIGGFSRGKGLTFWIFMSMLIGGEIGYDFPWIGQHLNIFSKIFIQLIKTIRNKA